MKTDTTYNGWKNRQTWNVSLWINNDESLYRLALDYVKQIHAKGKKAKYGVFARKYLLNDRTGDNISFTGTRLDYKALSDMLNEMDQ